MDVSPDARLDISVLGEFRVRVRGQDVPPSDWKRRKSAAIIKILALAPGHRMHREQLMELLWPEIDPDQAANSLYQALHVARGALNVDAGNDEPYLILRDQVVYINPNVPIRVDAIAFEEAAAEARRRHHPRSYQSALKLYTGDLLPDDRYEPWAHDPRERLRDEYLSLVLELADLLEEAGDYADGIALLRHVVADDPLHESAHRALMRLYARSDQRQHAIRQFHTLRQALETQLGVEPDPDSERLYEQIRAGEIVGTARPQPREKAEAAPPPRHNLPVPVSSFIGRAREKAEIRRLLAGTRLLTLTGPGGSGKTRLAFEVAADELLNYPDGAWSVELASLADPVLIPQVVAAALHIREVPGQPVIEALASYLRPRQILLILDNCEHLIDASAQLAETLLRTCPHLRILATSRQPLQVTGETTWLVASMTVPDLSHLPDVEQLSEYEAIQLFVERAGAVSHAFGLSPDNAQAVATLCYRLDGMPLAIELAAARTRSLSVQQIVERLDDRFHLLTSGGRTALTRQQTLRATLDWSYHLLAENEQILFARLSVFSGGFDLASGEAVCASEPIAGTDFIDLLDNLVQRSLVVAAQQSDRTRYSLLETIREYGRERLKGHSETEFLQEQHAEFFLSIAEEGDRQLRGPGQEEWLRRMTLEHDNFRAALTWYEHVARQGDPESGLRLAGALHWYCQLAGHVSEGIDWLQRLLALSEGRRTAARAYALTGLGWLSVARGEYSNPISNLAEAISIYRDIDDDPGLALALLWSTWMELFQGQITEARRRINESHELFTQMGNRWGIAVALQGIGFIEAEISDLDRAETAFEESLVIFHELHDNWGILSSEQQLAHILYRRGEYAAARERAEQVLKLGRRAQDRWMLVQTLTLLAEISRAQEDYTGAAATCEESLVLSRETGHRALTAWTLRDLGYVALAQQDPDAASAAFHEGLKIFEEHNYPLGVTCCLAGLAAVAQAESHSEVSARLLGAVESSLERLGVILAPADQKETSRTTAAVRAALGDAAFEAALAKGRKLHLDEAIAQVTQPI